MPKRVFKVCFFMFFLLSLNQISYSEPKEANRTISSDPPEVSLDSVPESTLETVSLENLSGNDRTAYLESENQTSPEYSKDVTPECLEEPDFFSPEKYSPPPHTEALAIEPELKLEANDHNSLNSASTPAGSTDYPLPETEAVTADPEIKLEADVNNSETKTSGSATSTDVTSREMETLSTEPELEPGGDDGNSPLSKFSAPAPSMAITLPEMDFDVNESPLLPSVSPKNLTVLPYTYVAAEEETYDILYEEDKNSWSSWVGENPLIVAGVVCFVGLAGLVYNYRKKTTTRFKHQSLTKGI